jgi:hypothetical protein
MNDTVLDVIHHPDLYVALGVAGTELCLRLHVESGERERKRENLYLLGPPE